VSWRSLLFWVVLHQSLACHWPYGIAYRSHLQRWRCSLLSNQPQVRSNPDHGRQQGARKCQFIVLQLTLGLHSPYSQDGAGYIFLQLADRHHI
jgi:hypothetical protein